MWPEYADGTDINAVCRNAEASLLASGDDFGKVKIFLYPATQPKVSISLTSLCNWFLNELIKMGFSFLFRHYRVYHIRMVDTAVM